MGQKTPFFNPNLVAALSQKPFRSVLQDFNRMQAMGKRLAFYKNILAQKYFLGKKHHFLTQILLQLYLNNRFGLYFKILIECKQWVSD